MEIKFLNNGFNYKKNLAIQKIKKYTIITGMVLAMSVSSDINVKENIEEYNSNKIDRIESQSNTIKYANNPYIISSSSNNIISPIEYMYKIENSVNVTSNQAPVPTAFSFNNLVVPIKDMHQKNEKKLVSITFDDGPGIYTDRLLDILEENNAKATFFVIGTGVKNYGDTVKRAYDLGNEIAIHGYTHTAFTELTINEIQNEIDTVTDMLIDLDITPSNLVRPPYGSINSTIKEELDYSFIKWYVDTEDWKSRNKDAIKEQIRSNIEEGAIILMHDIHEFTIDAVEEILPELIDEYEFVTVDELFKRNDQELEKHELYRKVKVLEKVEE